MSKNTSFKALRFRMSWRRKSMVSFSSDAPAKLIPSSREEKSLPANVDRLLRCLADSGEGAADGRRFGQIWNHVGKFWTFFECLNIKWIPNRNSRFQCYQVRVWTWSQQWGPTRRRKKPTILLCGQWSSWFKQLYKRTDIVLTKQYGHGNELGNMDFPVLPGGHVAYSCWRSQEY